MRFALLTLLVWLSGCPARSETPAVPEPLPADAYAHYLRGRVAALEGDDETAAREFERAAIAAPGEASIAVARVDALLGARRRRDAESVARRALERWPELPEVLLAAGRAYRATRRYATAAGILERARSVAKGDEIREAVALELGEVRIAQERPEHAAAVYRDLIKLRPGLVAPRVRLLSVLVKRKAFAEAEPVGRSLLELRPGHVRGRVLYARALRGLGRAEDALGALKQAFERSNGRVDVGSQLFDALLEANDRTAAISILELLASAELGVRDRIRVGRLFLRAGRSERARELAESVLTDGPNEDAIALRASAFASRRQFRQAAAAIDALDEAPIWAVAFAVEMLAHANLRAEALKRLETVAAQPHREVARSRIYELTGDVETARSTLHRARERWSRDRDVVYALAALELRAGNHRVSATLAESLLRADPDSIQLLNFLGYVLAEGGQELKRARQLLDRAKRRAPDSAGILDSVGWVHLRRGALGDAAHHLYRALRLAPVEAEILFHVGVLERELGRKRAALRRLRMAKANALEPSLKLRIDAELTKITQP